MDTCAGQPENQKHGLPLGQEGSVDGASYTCGASSGERLHAIHSVCLPL